MNVKVSVKMDVGNLRERQNGLRGKIADVVAVAAHRIEARAKTLVPVDTGATKNSITPTFKQDGLQADIGPSTEYAPYIELGVRGRPGRPFMVPALEAEKDAFVRAIKYVVENG